MERISDEMFVREMSILWQNLEIPKRKQLGKIIRGYFDQGDRAELIINRMQEKIEPPELII